MPRRKARFSKRSSYPVPQYAHIPKKEAKKAEKCCSYNTRSVPPTRNRAHRSTTMLRRNPRAFHTSSDNTVRTDPSKATSSRRRAQAPLFRQISSTQARISERTKTRIFHEKERFRSFSDQSTPWFELYSISTSAQCTSAFPSQSPISITETGTAEPLFSASKR